MCATLIKLTALDQENLDDFTVLQQLNPEIKVRSIEDHTITYEITAHNIDELLKLFWLKSRGAMLMSLPPCTLDLVDEEQNSNLPEETIEELKAIPHGTTRHMVIEGKHLESIIEQEDDCITFSIYISDKKIPLIPNIGETVFHQEMPPPHIKSLYISHKNGTIYEDMDVIMGIKIYEDDQQLLTISNQKLAQILYAEFLGHHKN